MPKEKYAKRNAELQRELEAEIKRAEEGTSSKSTAQLRIILSELKHSLETSDFPLSYPRFIVDSWDYSDRLGNELLELAELYKKAQ